MKDKVVPLSSKMSKTSDLQKYANSQFLALQQAQGRIKELEAEVAHLKELLLAKTPTVEQIVVSNEQATCEIEIEKLRKKSMDNPDTALDFEDTKKLDLLIKNLYLIKSHNSSIPVESRALEGLSEAALVEIAKTPPENESSD